MKLITQENWFIKYKKIIDIIHSAGGKAMFVGGCIRDFIVNRKIYDVDIATDIECENLMIIFKKQNLKIIPIGIKHGTVSVFIEKDEVQITTLRRDIECDGRHAIVEFTNNWYEDASRRDFTFNSLYCDLNGKIHDYFNGISDLKNRLVKFINDPTKRINEDHLRILRAFRFCAYINGTIEANSLNACIKYKEKLNKISGERIRTEMLKLLENDFEYRVLKNLYQTSILYIFFPFEINIDSININTKNINNNSIALIRLTYIISLSMENSTKIIEYVSKRWVLSKIEKKIIYELLENNMDLTKLNRILFSKGKDMVVKKLIYMYLQKHIDFENLQKKMLFIDKFIIPKFPITGVDIKQKGIKEGKKIGEIKNFLIEEWHKSNYKLSKKQLLEKIESK
ncbi:CCA tRNA nucleotidyltransferase [Anaplasmataceae bacterium AB001_6]|nr:CCA tRNA nucleotidyltransferase [Anaplasmataceae bacterium AB001_6]